MKKDIVIKTFAKLYGEADEIVTWKQDSRNLETRYFLSHSTNPDIRNFKVHEKVERSQYEIRELWKVTFERKQISYEWKVNSTDFISELEKMLKRDPELALWWHDGSYWIG